MEEALYEIDVHTLETKTLFYDEAQKGFPKANLPGYHGKGLYSGQGKLVYANNGEHGQAARNNPSAPSGVLAQWDGKQKDFEIILRSQFTEVTGPGGIYGSKNPSSDPIWANGWDARSLILMCMHKGTWNRYRLPKASHSYDGAHGWNTEWPRIREIGEGDNLLMTMHGMFWNFPKTFTPANSKGISPRSTYLKVIGDFARWGNHVVMGCDDTAKSEFLNKRKAKGHVAAPQSQSNLWFIKPEEIDYLGPVIGRGAVWLNDTIEAGTPSDSYLFSGFQRRAVHLFTSAPTTLTFEVDLDGNNNWTEFSTVNVDGYHWHSFPAGSKGTWIRVTSSAGLEKATAWFTYTNPDTRQPGKNHDKFTGLAKASEELCGGIVRPVATIRDLHFASDKGLYQLNRTFLWYELIIKIEKIGFGKMPPSQNESVFSVWIKPLSSTSMTIENVFVFPKDLLYSTTKTDVSAAKLLPSVTSSTLMVLFMNCLLTMPLASTAFALSLHITSAFKTFAVIADS